jgi:hypothetical protein
MSVGEAVGEPETNLLDGESILSEDVEGHQFTCILSTLSV